jgi:ankyrin repeat protein
MNFFVILRKDKNLLPMYRYMETESKLIKAVLSDNTYLVQQLLDEGSNPNSEWYGSTPLMAAISRGHKEIVTLLLVYSAQVNAAISSATPLLRAVSAGDAAMVHLLLTHKADPNGHVSGYDTPLLRAVTKGYRDIVQLLLNYGADANYGITKETLFEPLRVPLIVALKRFISFSAQYAHNERQETLEIVKLLLDHKANPNVHGNYTESTYGAQLRSRKPEAHKRIRGVDVDQDFQEVPLSIAAFAGEIKVVHMLLEYGTYIEGGGGLSEIPLHEAVEGLQPTMVQELLRLGAFVNSQDFYGQTAVHSAAYNSVASVRWHYDKAYECLGILLAAGADVNLQDYEGNTSLMYILAYYDREWNQERVETVISMLKQSGANLELKNVDGETAYTLACKQGVEL